MISVEKGAVLGKPVDGVPDGRYYSVEEYCIMNGTTPEQVRQWRHRGHIESVKMLGRIFIPEHHKVHEGHVGRPKKEKNA
jgi:hypothetical protein